MSVVLYAPASLITKSQGDFSICVFLIGGFLKPLNRDCVILFDSPSVEIAFSQIVFPTVVLLVGGISNPLEGILASFVDTQAILISKPQTVLALGVSLGGRFLEKGDSGTIIFIQPPTIQITFS